MQEFSLRGYASGERRSSGRRNYGERRSRVTLCFHPVAKSGRQGWALGGQGEQSQRRHARMLAPSGGGSNRGLASVRAGESWFGRRRRSDERYACLGFF